MDEITLARTLHQLAANPPLHPAPSADARRRASRLRRTRRTGAAGLAAVVAIGVVGAVVLQPAAKPGVASTTPSWIKQLSDPHNPNRATTGYVGISRADGGQWIVYWQGQRLCYQIVRAGGVALGSHCSAPMPTPTSMTAAIGTQFGSGSHILGSADGGLFYAVAPAVTSVQLHSLPLPTIFHQDGKDVRGYSSDEAGLSPVGASDFPARVVVAEGTIVSLRAHGRDGQQIGATLPGPAAPQLRQVLGVFSCSDTNQTGYDVVLPQRDDAKTCYGLGPVAMILMPKSADAVDDASQGWLVQVSLPDQDAAGFGTLTQRITGEPQPKNELAIVLEGKVVSAPTVQQAITGGQLQITGGDKGFSQQDAQLIAGEISG